MLAHMVLRVVLWASVLFSCARLARWATGSRLTGLAHLAWDGASGLVLFMALLVALGQIPGACRPELLGVAVLVLLFLALASSRLVVPRRALGTRSPRGPLPTITAVALACVGILGLVWNRVPSVFFDTLAYHIAQPNLWLVNGRIAPEPWSLHSWFPPGMSALYLLGLAIGGETAAHDANLLVGLLMLAMASDLAGRLWGGWARPLAAGCLLSLPITIHSLAIPAADLGHGAFAFGALGAWLLSRRDDDSASWRRRSCLLAAGAVLTKYLGILVPLALVTLLQLRERPGGLRRALSFAAPSLVLLLPWLLANQVAVGNPVAPLFADWIPTRGLAEGGRAAFLADARGGLPGWEDLRLLYPRLLAGDEESKGIYPTPAWGWLPVLLPAAGLVWARRDRALRVLFALLGSTLAIWFLTFRWERFLMGASGVLAVAIAGSMVLLWRRGGPARALPLLAGLLGVLSVTLASRSVLAFTGGGAVALGREEPRAFTEKSLPIVRLYHEANRRLDPSHDRVLILGETRHHGFDIPHAAPAVFNAHPLAEALASGIGPDEAGAALRRLGFTHLVVDPGWVTRSAARYPSLRIFHGRPQLLDQVLASLGPPLAAQGRLGLYRLPGG